MWRDEDYDLEDLATWLDYAATDEATWPWMPQFPEGEAPPYRPPYPPTPYGEPLPQDYRLAIPPEQRYYLEAPGGAGAIERVGRMYGPGGWPSLRAPSLPEVAAETERARWLPRMAGVTQTTPEAEEAWRQERWVRAITGEWIPSTARRIAESPFFRTWAGLKERFPGLGREMTREEEHFQRLGVPTEAEVEARRAAGWAAQPYPETPYGEPTGVAPAPTPAGQGLVDAFLRAWSPTYREDIPRGEGAPLEYPATPYGADVAEPGYTPTYPDYPWLHPAAQRPAPTLAADMTPIQRALYQPWQPSPVTEAGLWGLRPELRTAGAVWPRTQARAAPSPFIRTETGPYGGEWMFQGGRWRPSGQVPEPQFAMSPYGSDVAGDGVGAAPYQASLPWYQQAWQTAQGLPGAIQQGIAGLRGGQAGFGDPMVNAWNVAGQLGATGAAMAQVQQQVAAYNQQAQAQLQTQAQQQFQQQVQQQATPEGDREWWDEFTKVHGETPEQFYSRPENERGAGGWQNAVARDASYAQQYMGMTGKTSMTDEDWRNVYYRVLPGGGGGGGGGGEIAAAAVPKYQVPAMRYQGPQTSLTMPSGALGTIGAAGRQAVEDILRSRGWSPSGVMGEYGWGEYTRQAPRRVWFQPRLFKPYYGKGGKQAEKLFRKFEWTPPKRKRK